MLPSETTLPPKKVTDLLRDDLLAKLTDEWAEKWAAEHGPTFEGIASVPSQEAFLDALAIDIYTIVEQVNGIRNSKQTKLSNDTLLRFFDEQYGKSFSLNTRNVLAMYAGYVDFADFREHCRRNVPAPAAVVNVYTLLAPPNRQWPQQPGVYALPPRRRPTNWLWLTVLLVGVLALAGYYYLRLHRTAQTLTTADASLLKFTVMGQNHAYNPAKVTFAYDFSQLDIDTLTIDFGGNGGVANHNFARLTKPVGTYTFDFYKPGLHQITAKHGQQVLKCLPVYVQSHGWACWYLTLDWVNTNFAYHRFYKNGSLFLHPDQLPNVSHRNDYNILMRRTQPFAIQTDSLTVEYDLKYSPDEYAISCYSHKLGLDFADKTRFSLDFNRAGCNDVTPKNAAPLLTDQVYTLEFARLFYEWAHLKIQWKDRRLRVWVNGELLTNSPNNVPNAPLRNLSLFSKGSAMYDNVRISNSYMGYTVFSDNFDVIPRSTGGY